MRSPAAAALALALLAAAAAALPAAAQGVAPYTYFDDYGQEVAGPQPADLPWADPYRAPGAPHIPAHAAAAVDSGDDASLLPVKTPLNGRGAYHQLPLSGAAKGTVVFFHGCAHDGGARAATGCGAGGASRR